MKKPIWLMGILGIILVLSVVVIGCDTGTSGTSSPDDGGTDNPPVSSSGGGTPPERTTDVTGIYKLSGVKDMNPTGIDISATEGVSSKTITVTLSTKGGVEPGLTDTLAGGDQFNAAADFNPDVVADLNFIGVTIAGLIGGDTTTTIKQTNGAFKLFKGISETPHAPDKTIHLDGGKYTREKTYTRKPNDLANDDFDPDMYQLSGDDPSIWRFDYSIIIAEGTGQVELEITPNNAPTAKYRVVIKLDDQFKFVQPNVPLTNPATPGYIGASTGQTALHPPGITATVTKRPGLESYTVALAGDPGDTPPSSFTGLMAPGSWPSSLTNNTKTTMATISIDLVSPHGTTPNVRIKQENPGFKLYEEGIKTAHSPSGWNTIADADKVGDAIGYYGTLGTDDDAVFKWNAQTPATDHRILYKYRGNYVVADLAKPDDGLSIILWNGVPKAQRKAVITVIYKNNASPSVDVTKVITVDYSDVEF